ncbi:hypothetical protein [Candidatus Formimonas warabiya]|uniref:Uncharacterized protein n=1 Tax=Formimonas warabiya TaxID=1761012 RepID=A0A3G1KTB3_FORW1|nr:hypothetical protein [Candidatus Formimonas warabiya]ATW25395.1 hypothetical protein DCMF_11985 [Candidatus Formimonas warabiya]
MPYENERFIDKGKDDDKKKECNCCIKIEDSIVVLICGDIEIEKVKKCLDSVLEVKGSKKIEL